MAALPSPGFSGSAPTATPPPTPTLQSLFQGTNPQAKTPTVDSTTSAAGAAASGLSQTGAGLLSSANNALQPYLTRLQQIFGGDRAKTLEAAAPEVATVSGQYDTAFRTAQTSLSRGGGRNAVEASIPFQKAGAIETTLQNEQKSAGEQLGQVGTTLAGLGVQASEAGSQGFAQLLSSLIQSQGQTSSLIGGALGDVGSVIGDALIAFH